MAASASAQPPPPDEAETAEAGLVEVAHRIAFLKAEVDKLGRQVKSLQDDLDDLRDLKATMATLSIEHANTRNMAEISFKAVEKLQSRSGG